MLYSKVIVVEGVLVLVVVSTAIKKLRLGKLFRDPGHIFDDAFKMFLSNHIDFTQYKTLFYAEEYISFVIFLTIDFSK